MRNTWQNSVQGTVLGVLLPPREPEGQAALLQGPPLRAPGASLLESLGSLPGLVACCGQNSFVGLRHWLRGIYWKVTVASAPV